ncbi:response regulator transcription factor EsaR [Paraburkholderia sabiae]|jgi:DNA-binding NtrC family response regulator|uniref:Response regulator transcription factor EsaR n=1 Tax=Paraburkholderia sabiae TaxID=273251 RepID=A0ABU9Q5M3_9BURK|nr:response regulator transcription factor EsaR [Paraburkholderia sabiae]WJZ74280.1 response regulator transcription factor EsaR [Paraburkholderia sabiae]CAD6521735.1 Protein-glutamate methylesterase/protein-glutamine glutaminase [Paraburkholderia sabiae]CAG9237745.1 Response regulator containing CheY-like receiver, AAA-type ATPase, and DNA-binding domains [Paraburkholderia sabiae]
MATILVVDDEMGIRELLSEILSDEGHVVEVAENAQEARDYRQRQAPDLVLLDIWMPDTDGVTLLKEWAAQGTLTMPVIMMSGHATIDTAVEATKIGALNFLEKPIALQKLLKAVEQGLARGSAAPAAGGMAAKPAMTANASAVASAAALPMMSSDSLSGGMLSAQTASISFDIPLRDARDAFERAYFEYHLARENGSMTRVAEKTGLERTHLYRKLKQLGVDLGKNKGE